MTSGGGGGSHARAESPDTLLIGALDERACRDLLQNGEGFFEIIPKRLLIPDYRELRGKTGKM